MPIKTRLTTKGFEEYLERLAKAGQDIDAISDEALAAGGELLLEGMQRRVPVKTGNLKSKLAVTHPAAEGNVHYIDVGLLHGTDAETARYGGAQEYGTSDMSAQPYIRPTFDSDMRAARAEMRRIFEQREAL
jgi:HK97 gp10 family phage protein